MQPSGMKDVPIPRSWTPIGPHGHGHAARGCALWPGGLWPCGLLDTRKQAHGGTLSPVADTPWPSWSQGNDEKDASLGGKTCGHRVASTPASEGKAHRFADSREACALIDVPMRRRAPAIDEEGR